MENGSIRLYETSDPLLMRDDIKPLLDEREKTHGDYTAKCRVIRQLKLIVHAEDDEHLKDWAEYLP